MLAATTFLHYSFALIGVVVFILFLGVLVTIVVEMMGMLLNFKAKTLQAAILELLQEDEVLYGEFFKHPRFKQIVGNDKKNAGAPAYLPADSFAEIFMEILEMRGLKVNSPDTVLSAVKSLDTFLKERFIQYQANSELFKGFLERWFSEKMDFASEHFRKRAVVRLVLVSLVLVVAFDANVFCIYRNIMDRTGSYTSVAFAPLNEATDNLEKLVRIDPSLQQEDSLKIITRKMLHTLDSRISEGKTMGKERLCMANHTDNSCCWWIRWVFTTVVTALIVAYIAQFVYSLKKRFFKRAS